MAGAHTKSSRTKCKKSAKNNFIHNFFRCYLSLENVSHTNKKYGNFIRYIDIIFKKKLDFRFAKWLQQFYGIELINYTVC